MLTAELHRTEGQIETVQKQLATLRELLAILEGRRDSLIRQQTDLEGCSDRRQVGCR